MPTPKQSPRRSNRHLKWTLAVLAFAALGLTATSEEETPANRPPASSESKTAAGPQARQIAIVDPDTLQLTQRPASRPVGAQDTLSSPGSLNRSFDGLFEQELPNGVIMVDLQNRFQTAMVATVRPEGGYELDCDETLAATGGGS